MRKRFYYIKVIYYQLLHINKDAFFPTPNIKQQNFPRITYKVTQTQTCKYIYVQCVYSKYGNYFTCEIFIFSLNAIFRILNYVNESKQMRSAPVNLKSAYLRRNGENRKRAPHVIILRCHFAEVISYKYSHPARSINPFPVWVDTFVRCSELLIARIYKAKHFVAEEKSVLQLNDSSSIFSRPETTHLVTPNKLITTAGAHENFVRLKSVTKPTNTSCARTCFTCTLPNNRLRKSKVPFISGLIVIYALFST